MNLSQRLYTAAQEIWKTYYTHPFVIGIGDGSLPLEKFRFFMIQDYLYLYEYSKLFALGVVKAQNHDLMRVFSSMTDSTLNGEMKIHQSYMSRLGITEDEIKNARASLVNSSYTHYMLSVGFNGDALDILVAVLSCAWSYAMIGESLSKIPGACKHPIYGQWIDGYISTDYQTVVKENIDLVDTLGQNIDEDRYKYLEDVFLRCSRYEKQFWEMSWNMEL